MRFGVDVVFEKTDGLDFAIATFQIIGFSFDWYSLLRIGVTSTVSNIYLISKLYILRDKVVTV